MHIITDCPICKKDFMYHTTEKTSLFRHTTSNRRILREYPIQDEIWASRRWNEDRTEYEDLSGDYDVVCQGCDEKERNNIDNYDCGGSSCRHGCISLINFNEPCAHFKNLHK
jgi:hypothetical protein